MCPQLPTYTAQRNINTGNTAQPLRDEAKYAGQNQQKIIGTLQNMTQAWSDAHDVMQYTQFRANASQDIARQKASAKIDPDQYNLKYHQEELKKIKERNLKGFSNKSVEQKASIELDHDINMANMEIEETFKTKQFLTTELKLDELVNGLSLERSSARTSAKTQEIDDKMFQTVQSNVATGVITQARGRRLLDDYRLGSVDLDIMNDNAVDKDNSYVYEQLKAGQEGIYKNLTDSERAERLEKTELHIRRNKIMADYGHTINQDQKEKDLLLKYNTEAVTEREVKSLLVGTNIRKDFGEKYIKSLYEPPAEKTEHAAYNRIKMAQLNGKKQKEINNLVVDNISNLTAGDRTNLVNSSYDYLDSKTITIKASAQALGEWYNQSFDRTIESNNEINEIIFNFFNRIDKEPNANIDQIMQGVQKDYIKKNYPSTTSLPDVPNLIGNRNKIIGIYKKESKAGGKKVNKKPVNSVIGGMEIGFDDL